MKTNITHRRRTRKRKKSRTHKRKKSRNHKKNKYKRKSRRKKYSQYGGAETQRLVGDDPDPSPDPVAGVGFEPEPEPEPEPEQGTIPWWNRSKPTWDELTYIVTKEAAVRSDPDKSSNKIGILYPGDVIHTVGTAVSTDHNWVAIEVAEVKLPSPQHGNATSAGFHRARDVSELSISNGDTIFILERPTDERVLGRKSGTAGSYGLIRTSMLLFSGMKGWCKVSTQGGWITATKQLLSPFTPGLVNRDYKLRIRDCIFKELDIKEKTMMGLITSFTDKLFPELSVEGDLTLGDFFLVLHHVVNDMWIKIPLLVLSSKAFLKAEDHSWLERFTMKVKESSDIDECLAFLERDHPSDEFKRDYLSGIPYTPESISGDTTLVSRGVVQFGDPKDNIIKCILGEHWEKEPECTIM